MLSKFPTGGAFNSTLVERPVQPWWVSAATPHWAARQHTHTRAHAHTHTQSLQINQKLEKKCEARSAANSNKKPNKMLPATTKITVVWFVRATQLPPVAADPCPPHHVLPPHLYPLPRSSGNDNDDLLNPFTSSSCARRLGCLTPAALLRAPLGSTVRFSLTTTFVARGCVVLRSLKKSRVIVCSLSSPTGW